MLLLAKINAPINRVYISKTTTFYGSLQISVNFRNWDLKEVNNFWKSDFGEFDKMGVLLSARPVFFAWWCSCLTPSAVGESVGGRWCGRQSENRKTDKGVFILLTSNGFDVKFLDFLPLCQVHSTRLFFISFMFIIFNIWHTGTMSKIWTHPRELLIFPENPFSFKFPPIIKWPGKSLKAFSNEILPAKFYRRPSPRKSKYFTI